MSDEPIDLDLLHAALARALPASFGTPHVEDERAEVERIAHYYAELQHEASEAMQRAIG